ncbi:MAG: oligopeptide transport protein superfamily, atp bind, partial [Pseudomonadota bacterium]
MTLATLDAAKDKTPMGTPRISGEPPLARTLLAARDLEVMFDTGERKTHAVRGVSFSVGRGETVAIVGESGSGKSVSALSILKLLAYPAASHPAGEIFFEGRDLLKLSEAELMEVRGQRISMIFQEPMTSLNPLHTIEQQVSEIMTIHDPGRFAAKGPEQFRLFANKLMAPAGWIVPALGRRLAQRDAERFPAAAARRNEVLDLLQKVGIREAANRLDAYPHQLSGGQRQRVMIAMALANNPDLLIADEPTTALDVTIQAQILDLLRRKKRETGLSLLLITHDLGVVEKMADRVYVMQHGKVVESGPTQDIFGRPQHPYTRHLIASEPKGQPPKINASAPVVLETTDLQVWYPIKRGPFGLTKGYVKAVDGVSLQLRQGETIGVVGESGSGKSTLGLALLRLVSSNGPIVFMGQSIQGLTRAAMRPHRKHLQIVFQDPFGSLSPRMSVGEIIGEGLEILAPDLDADGRRARAGQALKEVGLDPAMQDRYPHEFSGGQRQRIAIARALAVQPRLLICDEPT